MKKLLFISLIVLVFMACKSSKGDKNAQGPITVKESGNLVTYTYKVEGLQDSIITDSIWKIIFQVEGVDKLVLSKADCTAVFTVNPEIVDNELLVKEITGRGGEIRN